MPIEETRSSLQRRRFVKSMAAVGTAGLFAGCSQGEDQPSDPTVDTTDTDPMTTTDDSPTPPSNRGGTIQIWLGETLQTLDPRVTVSNWVTQNSHYWLDSLYMIRPDNSGYIPHLATNSPQQVDELTYTIPIREGVPFHDGEEVTAEDVAYSINWVLNPENEAPRVNRYGFIDEVETAGDYEVTVHLNNTDAVFNRALATMDLPIVPKHYDERVGAEEFGNEPMGSGPFQFESHEAASNLRFTIFEDYFLGRPTLDEIQWQIIPEQQVGFVELASGGLHQTEVPVELVGEARNDSNINTKQLSVLGNTAFIPNCLNQPFSDIRGREALHHLVDYDEIMRAAVNEFGSRTWGYMPQQVAESWGFPWQDWRDNYYPEQNHDRAVELFEQTETGTDFEPLIMTGPNPGHQNAAVIIQREFEQIGVEAEVSQVDPGAFFENLFWGENHDIISLDLAASYPTEYYRMLRNFNLDDPPPEVTRGSFPMGFIHEAYSDTGSQIEEDLARLNDLVRTGKTVLDRDERFDMYVEAAEIALSLYPNISVYSPDVVYGTRTSVRGYEPTQWANQDLFNRQQQAWIDE